MELDDTINRVKQLISQREAIEAELVALFKGQSPTVKRTNKCGTCGKDGHSARTCPDKQE
jgi:hypothetical protein